MDGGHTGFRAAEDGLCSAPREVHSPVVRTPGVQRRTTAVRVPDVATEHNRKVERMTTRSAKVDGAVGTGRRPGASGRSAARWAVWLSWAAVALEGYDLVVLGSTAPALLADESWGLDATHVALVSTVGLVGVGIGAVVVGTLTDVIGRRRSLMGCVTLFSVLSLLCALAPTPEVFGVLRFLAGLGLGGCLPTALALASEHAPAASGSSSMTRLMTGYHTGAVLTALLAIPVLPALGWRWMYAIGALPALVVVPLMGARLPESLTYLLAHGRVEEARAAAAAQGLELPAGATSGAPSGATAGRTVRDTVRVLFSGRFLAVTVSLWIACFTGLLLVYGLNTWLPQIMRLAGYALGSALSFLLVLNVGAVLGLLVAGRVADRIGSKPAAAGWFTAAAVMLAGLSLSLPTVGVYVLVVAAGFFVFSAQVLVYGFIGRLYPAAARGTALGWASGFGRIGAIAGPVLGGALVDAGVAVPWGFWAFAAVGLLGAVAVLLVPRVRADGRVSEPRRTVGP